MYLMMNSDSAYRFNLLMLSPLLEKVRSKFFVEAFGALYKAF